MKIKILFLGLVFFSLILGEFHSGWASTISEDYLRGVLGARALGMAGAFGAIADTVEAACWNPAGLTQLKKAGFSGDWASFWGDLTLYSVSLAWPLPVGTFGFNFIQQKIDGLPLTATDANGRPQITGYFADTKNIFNLSYALEPWKNLSAGANLKFFKHNIYQSQAAGFGLDLGLLYKNENQQLLPVPFNIGLTAFNVLTPKMNWPSSNSDSFAKQFALAVNLPLSWSDYRVNLAAEGRYFSKNFKVVSGLEFWLSPALAERIGLGEYGLTFGLGLKIDDDFSLDVSFFNHPDLGPCYQLTISSFLPDEDRWMF